MESLADRDVRVGDYLDDKLQTAADLNQLDALIASVSEQHRLLKQQLEDAESGLNAARDAYSSHAAEVQARGEQFAKEQDHLDRRLQHVTQSNTSDDAVRQFEASMDKLRRLDVTAGYVELLREVDNLRNESAEALGKSDGVAVDAYRRLRTLHTSLVPLQDTAEGAAPHLLDHVAKVADRLHDRIRSTFVAQLESILKKLHWPREDAAVPPALHEEWRGAVGKLLELQRPELEAAEGNTAGQQPITLLPLQVLVHPLELKFRYHFEGDRPTNRLDRPEYFLQFITENVLGAYDGFIMESIQPLLLQHFRGSDLSMNPNYIDGTSAFITAVLPMVRSKVSANMSRVASQPQLLSHTIHEIIKFDTALRDDWGYTGGSGVDSWKGVAWEVLVKQGWFARWLQVESDFAFARYRAIVDEPGAGELDYDSMGAGQTKPTKAAIRVNDLLETITDRYRNLPSFSQKLSFLMNIQIELFDEFHRRLHGALEAFVARTSLIGRTVTGTSRTEQQELYGIRGLDELCRVSGSAEFLEKAMRDWSDDVFFLDMYAELQDRAQQKVQHGHRREVSRDDFPGDLSVAQVAEKTSATIAEDDGGSGGGMFDETAASYSRLRVRGEAVMTDMLQHNARETLRAYRSITSWASIAPSSSGSGAAAPSAPLPELGALLDYLSSSLTFLRKALGTVALRRMTRSLLSAVDENVFAQVVRRNNFSTQGAAQLAVDMGDVVAAVERSLGSERGVDGVVKAGMGRLLEAVELINLPVRGSDGEPVGEEGAEAGARLGLWQVEKRLFADNESARAVLEELGIERLSENEARSVLEKRVELSG